jgi:RNA polymerase sigma-70 factor (ECF subfamily)
MESYVDARFAASALADLSEDQRRVILLAALHGMTHDEISRELTLPLGTVKSHYARGIERVKRALEKAGT